MSNGNWIKVHRKILDWEWYNDTNTKILFLHLLLNANYKETKWRGIALNPGQILTGRRQISEKLRLSEQEIRTALKRLKSTGEITIKSHTKFSVITITKWDEYQDNNQQPNQQLTSNQPATNQQLTTSKKVKNIKKEKNNKRLTPLSPDDSDSDCVKSEDEAPAQNIIKFNSGANKGEQHDAKAMERLKIENVAEMWNIMTNAYSECCLPRVKLPLSERRRKRVAQALKNMPFRWQWRKALRQVPRSEFRIGMNDRGWKANFDWLVNTNENYLKLFEEFESTEAVLKGPNWDEVDNEKAKS